jgi:anti-sigma B factor antagonist
MLKMKVEHVQKNNVVVVLPNEKRLDASVAADFKSKLAELVEQGHVNLVINLSAVDLVDSSGLGVLVSVLKKVGNRGEIKVCNLKEGVRSLFQLTRLDKVFTLYHSEIEAVDSFNK